jgi:hypothetical protein
MWSKNGRPVDTSTAPVGPSTSRLMAIDVSLVEREREAERPVT